MRRKGIVFDLDDTLVETAHLRRFRDRRDWRGARAALGRSRLYPGFAEALADLSALQVPIALVTNSPSVYAEAVLGHHGIMMPVKVCYHDTTRRKPDPEPVLLAMEKAGIDPVGSLGIGDTEGDCRAYSAAGLITVGAGWSSELDESANWDEVVTSPTGLVTLLGLVVEADQ